jgi:hypothetical protein
MWLCSEAKFKFTFFFFTFMQQIFYNGLSAIQISALADLSAPESAALGSCIQVVNAVFGAVVAMLVGRTYTDMGIDYSWNYAALMCSSECFLFIHCLLTTESPSHDKVLPDQLDWRYPIHAFLTVYDAKCADYPDFRIIMWERTTYYAGLSCKTYLLFFIRDVIPISSLSEQSGILCHMILFAQGAAAIFSLANSVLIGRRVISPRTLGMLGSLLMAACLQFEFTAYIEGKENKIKAMMLFAILYGVGQTMYLSGDMALGILTLPNLEESSRLIGISQGISSFAGGVAGSLISSILMEVFGRIIPQKNDVQLAVGAYHLTGYTAVLHFGLVCNVVAGIIMSTVAMPEERARAKRFEPLPEATVKNVRKSS